MSQRLFDVPSHLKYPKKSALAEEKKESSAVSRERSVHLGLAL